VCYILLLPKKYDSKKRVLIRFYNCEKFQRRIWNEDTNPTCVRSFRLLSKKWKKRIKVRQTDKTDDKKSRQQERHAEIWW
jgi:hypothetical protein